MTTKIKHPQQEKNRNFGLPQAEFKPIESGGRKWFKITVSIVGFVLIIGAGIVYWFFYHAPSTKPSIEMYPIHKEDESETQEADVDFKELETLENEEDTKDFSASYTTTKPEKGTITRINTPQGYYYVIVGSFIDEDLASDYAKQLTQQGVDVMLINPPQGKFFFRVAIKHEDTFYDANEKAKALKASYGTGVWIMKY